MAKRFTDSDKWKDSWFTDLSNDNKLIWLYLLDNCDNAGLWKINMKHLNFFCSTNINVDDLFFIFKGRITSVQRDIVFIYKFCVFQYGNTFLKSKNKAVISAIEKLSDANILELNNGEYTLLIPYQYPIDTPKDKEKDKEKYIEQDKEKYIEQEKNKEQDKKEYKEETKEQLDRLKI